MVEAGLKTLGLDLNSPYVTQYTLRQGEYMAVTNGKWNSMVTPFDLPVYDYPMYSYPRFGGGMSDAGSTKSYTSWWDDAAAGTGVSTSVTGTTIGTGGTFYDPFTGTEGVSAGGGPVLDRPSTEYVDSQLHQDYCDPFYCVLDDGPRCPQYRDQLVQVLGPNPVGSRERGV